MNRGRDRSELPGEIAGIGRHRHLWHLGEPAHESSPAADGPRESGSERVQERQERDVFTVGAESASDFKREQSAKRIAPDQIGAVWTDRSNLRKGLCGDRLDETCRLDIRGECAGGHAVKGVSGTDQPRPAP